MRASNLLDALFADHINGAGVDSMELRQVGTSTWTPVPHLWSADDPGRAVATLPAALVGLGAQAEFEAGKAAPLHALLAR